MLSFLSNQVCELFAVTFNFVINSIKAIKYTKNKDDVGYEGFYWFGQSGVTLFNTIIH